LYSHFSVFRKMIPRAYHSTARNEAAEKTRGRILAAAIKHLRAKGAGGFSLDAVAQKAKVTRLTVYNQFGSRRVLLEAVFDDYAIRGGLTRLGDVMAAPDPRAGLNRLVEIFCDFWSFDHAAFASLLAMGGADAEFETALRARNERRRSLIGALVTRHVERGEVAATAATGLTDVLFALTSFPFYAELARGRSPQYAREQVQLLAGLAVTQAMEGHGRPPATKASRKRRAGLEPPGKASRKNP
jgi:AcrR family transcriptional regulator